MMGCGGWVRVVQPGIQPCHHLRVDSPLVIWVRGVQHRLRLGNMAPPPKAAFSLGPTSFIKWQPYAALTMLARGQALRCLGGLADWLAWLGWLPELSGLRLAGCLGWLGCAGSLGRLAGLPGYAARFDCLASWVGWVR